jgi:hypothetical protein
LIVFVLDVNRLTNIPGTLFSGFAINTKQIITMIIINQIGIPTIIFQVNIEYSQK